MGKQEPTLFWKETDPSDALSRIKCKTVGDAQAFLHGVCGIFALALHEEFGYPVTVYAEPADGEDDPIVNRIVHIYCRDGENFIDVRGITADEDAFLNEFSDFISPKSDSDEVIGDFPITDLEDMLSMTCTKEELAAMIGDAKKLIKEYHVGYSTNDANVAHVVLTDAHKSRAAMKKQLEDTYVGKRIRLISMLGFPPYDKPPFVKSPGDEGKCISVDDACQIVVHWDNGGSLRLLPDVDKLELI